MARSGESTKQKILDVAERLFAEQGYHGVTVRQITREAGVDVALANYHFGPKNKLFEAVMLRRANLHMQERLAALENCLTRTGGMPSVEDVIAAYADAFLERSTSGDPGWKNYFKLLAKLNLSPEWAGSLWGDYFDPFVQRLIDALRQALPGATDERLYWCYHFFAGTLTHVFAEPKRIDNLSGGLCKSSDVARSYELMVPFIAAGCERIARGDAAQSESVRARLAVVARK